LPDSQFDDQELPADELEAEDLEFDDFDGFDDQEADEWDDGNPGPELVWTGEEPAPLAPAPGCAVSFYLDNKLHHAVCLAVIGEELLLEHKGATRCFLFTGKVQKIVPRLRVGVASATIFVGGLKACHYRKVAKKWLQQMMQTGQDWKGVEGGGKVAPSPSELLKGQMDLF